MKVIWRCPNCNMPLGYYPKGGKCPNPFCQKPPKGFDEFGRSARYG
jgi:hypothetical protein